MMKRFLIKTSGPYYSTKIYGLVPQFGVDRELVLCMNKIDVSVTR